MADRPFKAGDLVLVTPDQGKPFRMTIDATGSADGHQLVKGYDPDTGGSTWWIATGERVTLVRGSGA